jgi:hypothetical protein
MTFFRSSLISEESQRHIVSQAVLDYIIYRPGTPDDPLAGVQDVLGMLRAGTASNSGAVLGGLLLTGDRRVVALIENIVTDLTRGAIIDEMVKTQSGFLYAPIIEFYLDWLEQLNSKAPEAEFGSLASGLVLMIRHAHTGMVLDIRRDFGLHSSGEPVVC